jgi:acyl-CoA thioester hydrolase
MKLRYGITDAQSGRRVSTASTTQVAVDLASKEMCFVSPAILFEKLGLPPL